MCQKGATSGTFSCNAPPRDPNPKPKALSPEIPHPKPTPSDTKVTEARVCEDHIKPWPRLSQTTLEKIHCPKNAQGHIPPALLLPLPSSPSFCNAAWRFLGTHSYEYTHTCIPYITLQYTTLNFHPSIHPSIHPCIHALRCIALHYIALPLHYLTLHYIHKYIHTCMYTCTCRQQFACTQNLCIHLNTQSLRSIGCVCHAMPYGSYDTISRRPFMAMHVAPLALLTNLGRSRVPSILGLSTGTKCSRCRSMIK